jgi:hypothetical protein
MLQNNRREHFVVIAYSACDIFSLHSQASAAIRIGTEPLGVPRELGDHAAKLSEP